MAHWALDDLRIEGKLKPGWAEGDEFAFLKSNAHSDIREAQVSECSGVYPPLLLPLQYMYG